MTASARRGPKIFEDVVEEIAPAPISQQAISKRENHVPRLQQVDNWADFPELPDGLKRK